MKVTGAMKLTALCLLLLAGCGQATDSAKAAGPETDGAAFPTIVSLNPCSDAILAEVTAPGQLLAVSHYSHDPAAASMPHEDAMLYRATGGTVEEVLALDPDVVVGDIFMPPATRGALERLGLRVEMLGIASTVQESRAQVRQLARLAGHAAAGEDLVARIDAAWATSAYDGPPVDALLWQQGGLVPGEASMIGQMMAHGGFTLHSAARGMGQGAYLPLEQVLADPPQVLLAAGDERMLTHPVLARMPDVVRAAFDPALLFCGGPSIPRALERLVEIRESLP